MLFAHYAALPDTIPIHYNAVGEVDNFGNKKSLFLLPTIATVIVLIFGYLSKLPHTFNYMVDITQDNAQKQYTIASRMLRYLKLSISCVFFLIFFRTLQIVNGKAGALGKYFLPFTLAIIFLPILYFLVQSVRATRHRL